MTATQDFTAARDLFPWNSEEFQADPYPWYERARKIGPVHQTDEHTFVVLGYADVMHYARLKCMSIAEPALDGADPHPWTAFEHTVLSLDPPQHTRMRRLTNRWLTPKMVQRWAAITRELTTPWQ